MLHSITVKGLLLMCAGLVLIITILFLSDITINVLSIMVNKIIITDMLMPMAIPFELQI